MLSKLQSLGATVRRVASKICLGGHSIEVEGHMRSTAPSRNAEGVELRGTIGAENRDAEGVEGVGNGEGVSPSPAD